MNSVSLPQADQSYGNPQIMQATPHWMGDLDAQNLEILVEADGDPVWLGGSPLDLVDLALGGRVREDGVLDGPRHLLNVPDQRLVVVACRKQNVQWQQSRHVGHHTRNQPCHVVGYAMASTNHRF